MSYVVLARKWRPQTFDDLTGQEHVAQTLRNAIERGRVPHAMLFTGARGVGKTSSARIVAMALNCAGGPTTTPCGTCPSCTEIQRSQSVDVLEIDGASNRGINEIRELREGVRYAPQRDRYKVYIIDEVHMLTNEAFNALLKTLEEPPPHVIFVFATTEAHKIPVTILSRCQRFDFRRIPFNRLVARLRQIVDAEGIAVTDEVLGLISRQAAGGMRDALSLLDQVIAFAGSDIDSEAAAGILGAAERRQLFRLTDALFRNDLDAALATVDEVLAFGVDLPWFAEELVSHLRDLAVVAVARNPATATTLTDEELDDARAQVAQTSPTVIHRAFEILCDAAEQVARSNHARMLFDMALVQITALEPTHAIRSLVQQLDALARGERLSTLPEALAPPPVPARSTLAEPVRTRSVTAAALEPAAPEAPEPAAPGAPTPAASPSAAGEPAAAKRTEASSAGSEPAAPKPPETPDPGNEEPAASEPVPADPSPPRESSAPATTRGSAVPPPAAHLVREAPSMEAAPSPPAAARAAGPAPAAGAAEGAESDPDDPELEALWRTVIEALNVENPMVGTFARGASVRVHEGRLRVVLGPESRQFARPDHIASLHEVATSLVSMQVEVDLDSWNEDEDAPAGVNVARLDEARLQAARAAQERMARTHASTRNIETAWPAARVDVQIMETLIQEEENEA